MKLRLRTANASIASASSLGLLFARPVMTLDPSIWPLLLPASVCVGAYRFYQADHASKKRFSKIRLTNIKISQHTRVNPLSLELADSDDVKTFFLESSIFS